MVDYLIILLYAVSILGDKIMVDLESIIIWSWASIIESDTSSDK